jgi:hypothetical protein
LPHGAQDQQRHCHRQRGGPVLDDRKKEKVKYVETKLLLMAYYVLSSRIHVSRALCLISSFPS